MSTAEVRPYRRENQHNRANVFPAKNQSPLQELNNFGNNSAMASSVDVIREQHNEDEVNTQDKPRLSIRQLREAAQKEASAKETAKAQQKRAEFQQKSGNAPPKKKQSVLGGLFQIREPTQIALEQVAAQMIAQHGSTSATKVPNVRMEKMPEFVPKVNSRWDGIPENMKQKAKKDKEKEKQRAQRDSFFSLDPRSGSDEDKRRANSRNSNSTTGSSLGAYCSSSGSQGASSRTRFYAQSVNSSGDLASQQRTSVSHLSRSPGSQRTVESTDFALQAPPHGQRRSRSTATERNVEARESLQVYSQMPAAAELSPVDRQKSSKSYSTRGALKLPSRADNRTEARTLVIPSRDSAQPPTSHGFRGTDVEPMPSHSLSPRTPQDTKCNHPAAETLVTGQATDKANLETASPYGRSIQLQSPTSKSPQVPLSGAFLAGEAQEVILEDANEYENPFLATESSRRVTESRQSRSQQDLEKRPDSSRDRLGLRASMVFIDETTPWQGQDTAKSPLPSPQLAPPSPSTKTRFSKTFGKIGK